MPDDAKINVGCLGLRSEMNYGNIRLRMSAKSQEPLGGLPLRSDTNSPGVHHDELRMTLKQILGEICL